MKKLSPLQALGSTGAYTHKPKSLFFRKADLPSHTNRPKD
jgi:hypothetical protein